MVRVRVGSRSVVHVEQPVVEVLAIVTTCVEAGVRRVEVPVIARMPQKAPRHAQETPMIDKVNSYIVRGKTPSHTPLREFKESAAAVRVRAGSRSAVHAEQPAAEVLAIATTCEEAGVRRVEAPAIARICAIRP